MEQQTCSHPEWLELHLRDYKHSGERSHNLASLQANWVTGHPEGGGVGGGGEVSHQSHWNPSPKRQVVTHKPQAKPLMTLRSFERTNLHTLCSADPPFFLSVSCLCHDGQATIMLWITYSIWVTSQENRRLLKYGKKGFWNIVFHFYIDIFRSYLGKLNEQL